MKIGIMSVAFPRLSFAQVLDFLSGNGFGSIEVACWPAAGSARTASMEASRTSMSGC